MALSVIPPVKKLCKGVIRILGMNPGHMTLQGTNTYLLGTGKQRILLDTGDAGVPEYIANLKSVLEDEGAAIEHIIITHWHHDHIGGVKNILDEVCKATVWKFPRSDGDEVCDIPLKFLKDGDVLCAEDAVVKVHHTPGHTTDHIILTESNADVMFSGDNVLGEGTAVFEDLYNYMKSLQYMLDLKPNVLYPGHGPVVEDAAQKIQFYIEHRNAREAQILSVLRDRPREKLSAMDIVKLVYSNVDPALYAAASYNVTHHLDKLKKENKVVSCNEDLWQYYELDSNL